MLIKSKHLLDICIFFVIAGSLAYCEQQVDWLSYRGVNGSGSTSNSIYPPLGQRWKLLLQNENSKKLKSFNPPTISGSTIFFGSNDKNFYALDSDSGYMRWIFPTKNKVNSVPFVYEDTIYFGSNDGNVYALDVESGKKRWSFPTGKTVQSLVARYQDRIVFTSDAGASYFLDPRGRVKDKLDNPTWSHHTFQIYKGIVYWAPLKRGFGAYDIRRKRFLWKIPVNFGVPTWYSFPAIDETKVYFARNLFVGRGSGSKLTYYALDRHQGRTIWKRTLDFEWSPNVTKNSNNVFYRYIYLLDYMAPSLWKNLIIYTSGDAKIRTFNKIDGKLIWEKSFPYHISSSPTVAGNRVYFGIYGNDHNTNYINKIPPKLICLAASDGTLLWEMNLEGAILSAPVISGKRMFFGTDTNRFYILEEIF